MKDDGFSYPKKQYNTPYRKCYVYTCHICGLEIKPYHQKRVKGKITCSRCKNKFKGVERMTLKCIGSGSSGNCYILTCGNEKLILDCGLPIKVIKQGLGFDLGGIQGVLITHAHT